MLQELLNQANIKSSSLLRHEYIHTYIYTHTHTHHNSIGEHFKEKTLNNSH